MSSPAVPQYGGGRGRIMSKNMRRPGQFDGVGQKTTDRLKPIENLMNEMTLSSLADEKLGSIQMQMLIEKVKNICASGKDVEALVDAIHSYCSKNKESAVIGAMFSGHIGDFEVDGKKFRTLLLQKIQTDFDGRESVFPQTEKFIQNVTVFCELFQNLRLANGDCFVVLTLPLITYLEMLLRNGSDPEIDTFVEQTLRCYQEIQQYQPDVFEKLMFKIRTKIVTSSSELTRWSLLHLIEEILSGSCSDPTVEEFYEVAIRKAKLCG